MAKPDRKFLDNMARQLTMEFPVVVGQGGAVTVDFAPVFLAPWAGRIASAVLVAGENGADGTDAMTMELDVLIGGISIFTTKPKLDRAAGTGIKSTLAAGTGITVGVLDATKLAIALNDEITASFDITRTTPETEYSDIVVSLILVPESDFDPDMTVVKS